MSKPDVMVELPLSTYFLLRRYQKAVEALDRFVDLSEVHVHDEWPQDGTDEQLELDRLLAALADVHFDAVKQLPLDDAP